MDFLKKLILYFKKPKVIITAADKKKSPAKIIFEILKPRFKTQKLYEKIPNVLNLLNSEIFIIETEFKNNQFSKKIGIFLRNSQLPILVVSHIEIIEPEPENFSIEDKKIENIKKLVLGIPPYGSLILNVDEKIIREIDKITNLKSFSFGFSERADFIASDINEDKENINFKLNYKGNSVPIWLNKVSNREEIYDVLSAICVGRLLGLNIVEMSNSIKNL